MRTVLRSTLIAGLTGALMVSAAWAGIGLSPVPTPSLPAEVTGATSGDSTTATATNGDAPAPLALGGGRCWSGPPRPR